MDFSKIAKQMIEFQKATFDNTFNAVTMVQTQSEKMVAGMLEQTPWLPEEGRNAIENWVNAYKEGRQNFKNFVDEKFAKVESYFEANKET